MKQPVIVEITETAFQTLRQLKGYMSLFITPDQLNLLMTSLVQQTQQLIEEVPYRPACPELSLIGIQDYRQLNLLENYKVLYRLDLQSNKAFIIAFMRQKQSAQKLLVDLALMQ
ncbi:hypothetical protein [Endozoicomonas sp.]|uniref:hypothetical protein n=1 Tax=Endozoicomonas sp. TaxID=1892382 RepID=UPI00383BEAB9